MRLAHRPEPEFGAEPLELGADAVNPGGTGPGQRWTDAGPAHWAIPSCGQRQTSDK